MMKSQQEIEHVLIGYLLRNPDAGDTLEGISRWWLHSEYIEESVEKISTTLEALVAKGLMEKRGSVTGNTYYSIRRFT